MVEVEGSEELEETVKVGRVWVRADSDNWVLAGGVELGWAASTAILDLHIWVPGGREWLCLFIGCRFLRRH